MTVNAQEISAFLHWLAAEVDAGRVDGETEMEFLKAAEVLAETIRRDEDGIVTFELPAQYAALFNRFSQSEQCPPNTDSNLLAAKQLSKSITHGPDNPQPRPHTMKQFFSNPNPKAATRGAEKSSFLDRLGQLTRGTKAALDDIETMRRDGSDAELIAAVRKAFSAVAGEERHSFGDPVWKYLEANPEQALLWSGMARKFCGGRVTPEENEVLSRIKGHVLNGYTMKDAAVSVGIVPGDSLGIGLFPIPVSPEFHESVFTYSAFRDLGVRVMLGQYTKFVNVTGVPSGVVISPTYQGKVVIPADTSMNGENATEDICNTAAIVLEISDELAKDQTLEVAYAVLSLVGKGMGKVLDTVAFMSNGADDLTSAWQTGIFMNAAVPTVTCQTVGTSNIKALTRGDFLDCVAAVAAAALVQPCRWYMHPAFIPDLLRLRDGPGNTYLLRSPAQTDSGEWELCGWPVTWVAVAPSLQQANQKVCAFGQPSAYTCALRNEMEVMRSTDGTAFARNQNNLRAIQRHKFVMMNAAWFSILKFS